MQEVVTRQNSEVAVFEPNEVGIKIAAVDAARKYAQKAEDWDSLHKAVKEEVKIQKGLVAWWGVSVQSVGNPQKKSKDLIAAERGLLTEKQAEQKTTLKNQQVSRWRSYLKTPESEANYKKRLYGRAHQAAMGVQHGTQGKGEYEWYTPEKYVEAARQVFGQIELDPASSDIAQETVRAERYFTIENDALTQSWVAKTVFLNPPYSQPEIWDFVDKLVNELTAGHIGSAILLTHNSTDTAWFHRAEEIAVAICFTRGRIQFIHPDGDKCTPPQGQSFFYFGDNQQQFSEVFMEYGFVR